MSAATLLIDDDQAFLEALESHFALTGVGIEVASNWDEGAARFRAGLHELVVADYDLQDRQQGLMLLLKVKQMRASTKLVLISGAITPGATQIIEARKLVDDFRPKGPNLIDYLLVEARRAEERADGKTDWQHAARAHIDRTEIDEDALAKLDEELNSLLGR